MCKEDSTNKTASPPFHSPASDTAGCSSRAPVRPDSDPYRLATGAHSLSNPVPNKARKTNCPILEEHGLLWDSKQGIDFCVQSCPRSQCVLDDGFTSNRQNKRARNKEIRRLNKINDTPAKQLADMFGLSTRTIERALNHK